MGSQLPCEMDWRFWVCGRLFSHNSCSCSLFSIIFVKFISLMYIDKMQDSWLAFHFTKFSVNIGAYKKL